MKSGYYKSLLNGLCLQPCTSSINPSESLSSQVRCCHSSAQILRWLPISLSNTSTSTVTCACGRLMPTPPAPPPYQPRLLATLSQGFALPAAWDNRPSSSAWATLGLHSKGIFSASPLAAVIPKMRTLPHLELSARFTLAHNITQPIFVSSVLHTLCPLWQTQAP